MHFQGALNPYPERTVGTVLELSHSTVLKHYAERFEGTVPEQASQLLSIPMQNTPKVPYSRPSTRYKNREIELVTRHLSSLPNRTPMNLSEYDFTEIPFLD